MNEQSPPKPRRATVVDVARAAGVSPGTVSNAISGKRKVDSETRKRIEAAIAQLGYVPNLAARRMRTGRTNTIALFSSMPIAVAAGSSKLGFLMEVAASAAITALEHNSVLALVPPVEDPVKAFQTISMDGAVIVEPAFDDPVLKELLERGVPTVVIGGPLKRYDCCVNFDYHLMAELLVDHLFDVGAENFVLVVGEGARQTNIVFRQVYEQRATRAGMPVRIIEVFETDAETGAQTAVEELIKSGHQFDGVLVPIDAMATGVMSALRDGGLRVPHDVRIATRYDGLRARAEQPALTAVNLHLEEVASQAIRSLVALVETGTVPDTKAIPAPDLIIRESSRLVE